MWRPRKFGGRHMCACVRGVHGQEGAFTGASGRLRWRVACARCGHAAGCVAAWVVLRRALCEGGRPVRVCGARCRKRRAPTMRRQNAGPGGGRRARRFCRVGGVLAAVARVVCASVAGGEAPSPPEPPPGPTFSLLWRGHAALPPPGHAAALRMQRGQCFRGGRADTLCRPSGVLGPPALATAF